MSETIRAGVVGVGNMGRHHVRVYSELPDVELIGVHDVDRDRAREVAAEFDTRAFGREELLERADAVSIAVPTRFHEDVARDAIDAGTNLLVEKPFVDDVEVGRDLLEAARAEGLVVQVGHVERYNPAILALQDVMVDVDPIAFDTRRQGPPVDRDTTDNVVFDLMIHDIDIVLSLAGADVADVSATGVDENKHVVAQIEFENGHIASLTASRITQERIRELAITAADCHIDVDYMDQSVQIHRHSLPEYVASDGDVRYRHESVIERPTVETGEPLKNELGEFAESVREGGTPRTTGEDGLRAVAVAERIAAEIADESDQRIPEVRNV